MGPPRRCGLNCPFLPHTPFHTQCARLVSLHLEPPFLCCVCCCATYQMYLERARAVLYAVGDTSSPGLAARVCSGVRTFLLSLRCRTCVCLRVLPPFLGMW
jgi:hypothetical protein